jgi:hypothetical protein
MGVTIRNAMITPAPVWGTRKDGSHVLNNQFLLIVRADRDGLILELTFAFREGFRCDGLSVPLAFRWFLPSWDSKNALYNVAGALHDWLYATKGYSILRREECDDIFRGLLRESGIGRFKAGCADKAVEWFAGGKNHWGNDSYQIADKCSMVVRYL